MTPVLFPADPATFWPLRPWTDFATDPRRTETLVVIPVAGMADWGLGLPLDLEERVLAAVLRHASELRGELPLLVTPPVRFVVGPAAGAAFTVAPPVACALLEEIVLSVQAAGYPKVVFLNSSPWNEELCDAVARDLRIDRGVQMFCVNLAALGLDLDPGRNPRREAIATLFAAALATDGSPPESGPPARHLVSLLREIHARAPLRHDGRIIPMTPP
jgi:creatinine amidohydrolase